MDNTKYEKYRSLMLKQFKYDIDNYKNTLLGSTNKKNTITDFNYSLISKGINVLQEHTTDIGIALEITLDHLSEGPDYYTRLSDMLKLMLKQKATTSECKIKLFRLLILLIRFKLSVNLYYIR